jgi:hypothetical protein
MKVSKVVSSYQISNKKLYAFLFSLIRDRCPSHIINIDFITIIIFDEERTLNSGNS